MIAIQIGFHQSLPIQTCNWAPQHKQKLCREILLEKIWVYVFNSVEQLNKTNKKPPMVFQFLLLLFVFEVL